MTEINDLDTLADEIRTYRESFKGKKIDEKMAKKGQNLQNKVSEKFEGLTKDPSKAIQELLLVKSSRRWGNLKSRVYIRPAKVNGKDIRGSWLKDDDATLKKKLQNWLKQVDKDPSEKKKLESKLKATLFQTRKA